MHRFLVYRRAVPTDTHNEDQRGSPTEVQYEGVVFADGSCAIRWRTAVKSTSVWSSLDDLLRIHGHPEYGTEIVWLDAMSDEIKQVTVARGFVAPGLLEIANA